MLTSDLCDAIKTRWLLVATPCVLLLAVLNPHLAGRLHLDYPVRCAAVFLVFLSAGVRVDGQALLEAWRDGRTVLFIQGCSFLVVPVLVKLTTVLFGLMDANEAILKGVMSISCMGPAVCSGVVLTRLAHADEATAIISAALGSVLSVAMTPLLLLFTCGSTTLESVSRLPLQPLVTIALPLLLGRLFAKLLCGVVSKRGGFLLGAPLLLMYTCCCDALLETEGQLDAQHVLLAVLLVLSTVCISAAVCRVLGNVLLSPVAVRTSSLCVSQRALAFALPRLHLLFPGGPLLTLPLLIQQPAQLLLGAAMAVHIREEASRLPR